MIIQILLFLLSLPISENFPPINSSEHNTTNVYHYNNMMTLKNFDGTRSTINLDAKSATLKDADGSLSTINFSGNSSTLIASDGSSASVFHNGLTSTIFNSDGTQIIVNHMRRSSSCLTANGKHLITHSIGNIEEIRNKDKIDVLIHSHWANRTKSH